MPPRGVSRILVLWALSRTHDTCTAGAVYTSNHPYTPIPQLRAKLPGVTQLLITCDEGVCKDHEIGWQVVWCCCSDKLAENDFFFFFGDWTNPFHAFIHYLWTDIFDILLFLFIPAWSPQPPTPAVTVIVFLLTRLCETCGVNIWCPGSLLPDLCSNQATFPTHLGSTDNSDE